jgi:hypothetical protein
MEGEPEPIGGFDLFAGDDFFRSIHSAALDWRLCENTMVGYSGTPLWKKLGYRPGVASLVEGAPIDYISMLALPADLKVTWLPKPNQGMKFVHLFESVASRLKLKVLSRRKRIAPDGVIWVSWPKKSSGVATDITEDVIREIALPIGLVDVKVCAIDGVWSGLKLMIRKELR